MDGAIARNETGDVLDFISQSGEIRRRYGVILLNDHVAGAEEAQAFAEGKMHVERNRAARFVGLAIALLEIVGAEIVLPDGSGGIAGVARAGAIVLFEEGLGDFQALAVEFEM